MNVKGKINVSYVKAKEQIARLNKSVKNNVNNQDIPPGQVLTTQFPTLDLGIRPDIPKESWIIKVYGEVENPMNISYLELLQMPKIEITKDFHCVTKWSKRNVEWTGVQFKYIADLVKVRPSAAFVVQEGYDGYTTNLPLEVLLNEDVIIAYKLFGGEIPPEHGGLIRMIVPERYGWKGSKFLSGIKFTIKDEPGFWEERGYNNNADYSKEERYS